MTFARTIFAAALVFAGVAATPAVAQDTISVGVSYAGLDLASAQGKAVLDRRIANAVRSVCGDADGRDLQAFTAMAGCRAKARAGANIELARVENGGQLALATAGHGHRR